MTLSVLLRALQAKAMHMFTLHLDSSISVVYFCKHTVPLERYDRTQVQQYEYTYE